ncbi:bifunctional UDP-sugar hydrolase/5'-nucleotidase [Microbacterium sp. BK668]|uniref:bifunctional metallophosphatase/5'-nucleotidase n=1 Tax=Microbacterium sp. BK668 TaxID=2512118 RepID=UPI0010EB2E8B|nr:bifunctional UDP-sugar hydrolase/5'-nucleotidase [Microbacterium sp. BK668]TDN93115.1 5'-nucleotidase [Microbacterium sp. BK668]
MPMRSHPEHSTRNRRRLATSAAAAAIALGAGLIAAPPAHAATIDVQILATNDFHGRIGANGVEAGAAKMAGVVDSLRAANPNTVFAAAGDLIGASTFESFIQDDKPTIDALNAAGLEVSAVGNHELDQGYDDLVNRVMAPYDPVDNPWGGATWEYIASNLKMRATGDDAVPASWIKEFGDVQVGFVGAVTEDLPALVSPTGIADLEVRGIVESVNAEAAALEAAGADLVVMLVHEGSPTVDCTAGAAPGTAWGEIVSGVSSDVDAIVSGHTHLAYNCSYTVQDWVDEGRAVTKRPVVSAGQYGTNLNQLIFRVDGATGVVQAVTQTILPIATQPGDPDEDVAAIVAAAFTAAEELGKVKLGTMAGPFYRAKLADGTTENRGGESTLGNLVAEVQQWATEQPESGAAQIAFMNPGGMRQDMTGTALADGTRELTYRQAAVVQPFANTLVNMRLTGAQIKTVLEQQWQRDAYNGPGSRPYLRLGTSEGFEYTYTQEIVTEVRLDNPATQENEAGLTYDEAEGTVTGMWLHGEPIDLAATYSVTANSFLAGGGDNFREFANGTSKRDTGKVDLAAMVDYMEEFAQEAPLPVDYSQRAVSVEFPDGAPAAYDPAGTVAFDVSSWAMTGPGDLKDTELEVTLGDQVLGTFPVDNTVGTRAYDDYGQAKVSVPLPADVPLGGSVELTLTGPTTGTSIAVPLAIDKADSTTLAWPNKLLVRGNGAVQYTVRVSTEGGAVPTGEVKIYDRSTLIATVTLDADDNGLVKVKLPRLQKGLHLLWASYGGNDDVKPSQAPRVPVLVL